jgi:microcystin-dependent protein
VYQELYAICGSLFGTETSTHFYLPDLRGKTIAGYNADDTTLNTIGKLLGAVSHTHTSAAHTHTIAGHTHTSAAHTHTSAAHTHTTGNHTLTIAEMPSHGHNFTRPAILGVEDQNDGSYYSAYNYRTSSAYTQTTANVGGGGAHSHGNTGSTTPGKTGSTTPGATGSTSLTTNSTTPGATGSASNYQPTFVANWIVKAKHLVSVTAIVENNLTSTSEVNALSAAQGKILNDKIEECKEEMVAKIYDRYIMPTNDFLGDKRIYRCRVVTFDSINNSTLILPTLIDVNNVEYAWIDPSNSYFISGAGTPNIRSLPINANFYIDNSDTCQISASYDKGNVHIISNSGWGSGWMKAITVRFTYIDDPND